jgi:hypothetical protein
MRTASVARELLDIPLDRRVALVFDPQGDRIDAPWTSDGDRVVRRRRIRFCPRGRIARI